MTEIVLRFDLWSKHPVGSPSVRRVARRLASKRGPVHHAGDAAWHAGSRYITKGFDRERNTFIQYYGGSDLDASLLLIPQLGFLPSDDPRVIGTIEAIERDLVVDGLVMRYPTRTGTDGLPAGEGAFLVCSFWLANSLALIGRQEDAVALFERL